MKKLVQLLFVLIIFNVQTIIAQEEMPVDNAYATKYDTARHWTYGIKWDTVYNVKDYGAKGDGVTDDLNAIKTAMQDVLQKGGGVVYFPAGDYVISDNLMILDSVVLRGETPANTDAKDTTYALASKLIFPKYEPTFTGNGTDNSTAFKKIYAQKNGTNLGIVYLDVDHARIEFLPHEWKFFETSHGSATVGGKKGTFHANDINENVLIFGCINNNAAIPAPKVPKAGEQDGWQRFSWRFAANINIYVGANGCICNNRINNNVTDNYLQPGYKIEGVAEKCSNLPDDNTETVFSYTNHYGIALNKFKNNEDGQVEGNYDTGDNGDYGTYAWSENARPEDEPDLFAPGNEIRDNWIFRTMRAGITGAGYGLQITNNIVRDSTGKKVWYGTNGVECQINNSATYENRGIDYSGWNVLIEGNTLEMFTHSFGTYSSIDGEGILMQPGSGGTRANGYTIRNNTLVGNAPNNTNPAISLYRMRCPIDNVIIENNTVINNSTNYGFIMVTTAEGEYPINNVSIVGNTCKQISINAEDTDVGSNCVIKDNVGFGSEGISGECFVKAENNTNFTAVTGTDACEDSPVTLVKLNNKDTAIAAGTAIEISGEIYNGTVTDTVILYFGTNAIDTIIPTDGTFSHQWTAPSDTSAIFTFTAMVFKSGSFSNGVMIQVNVPDSIPVEDPTFIPSVSTDNYFTCYPNPANDLLYVKLNQSGQTSGMQIEITSLTGAVVIKKNIQVLEAVDVSTLKSGFYMVRLTQNEQQYFNKIMIK